MQRALSGPCLRWPSQQEIDLGQTSTLLCCFVDATGTDSILMSLLQTLFICISYSYLGLSCWLFFSLRKLNLQLCNLNKGWQASCNLIYACVCVCVCVCVCMHTACKYQPWDSCVIVMFATNEQRWTEGRFKRQFLQSVLRQQMIVEVFYLLCYKMIPGNDRQADMNHIKKFDRQA